MPEFREAQGIKGPYQVAHLEPPSQSPGRGQLARHRVGPGKGNGGQPRSQNLGRGRQQETGIQPPRKQHGRPPLAPEILIQILASLPIGYFTCQTGINYRGWRC